MNALKRFMIKNYFLLVLIIVIAFAFLLRYFQASIGLPYIYFWDEPQTASTALRIMKTGDYNPHFFNYGSLMIYLNLMVDKLHYIYLLSQTSELNSLNEIKINADTGWHWTISHPSFYYWNRILTAVLGTGTVLVTFFIGKIIFNKWIGLISAIFIATLPIHIDHSAYITSDAPVAFFALSVVLFSLLFIKTEHKKYFVLSLIFVGLAMATKYNAGLTYILPFTSLLWMTYKYKKLCNREYWIFLFVIPAFVFIIAMPYAILDFRAFIGDVLYEMRHYKVIGHKGAESIPGWEHFSFQMNNFYQNIGFFATVLVFIGFVGVLFRPLLALTLLLPVVYILYMSGMKVNFHRNFIQVYPFIAILIGSAYYYTFYLLSYVCKKSKCKKYKIPLILITILAISLLANQAYTSYKKSFEDYNTRDTRTQTINTLNNLKDIDNIVIAKEIRFHFNDLKKLKHKYSIKSLELMKSSLLSDTVYVLPLRVKSQYGHFLMESKAKQAIIDKVQSENIYQTIGDDSPTFLDKYSENPALTITKKMPNIKLDPSVISLDTCSLPSDKIKLTNGNNLIFNEGNFTTATYLLEAGVYHFNLTGRKDKSISRKTKELNVGKYKVKIIIEKDNNIRAEAKLKVSIYDDSTIVLSRIVELTNEFMSFNIPFFLSSKGNINIRIDYINNISESRLPSQVYIKELNISSSLNNAK